MSTLVKVILNWTKTCPYCRGSGYSPDGGQCDECGGLGEIEVFD